MRLAVLVVALAGAAAGQSAAGSFEAGKRAFVSHGCYECHGYAAQGSRDGPRLAVTSSSAPVLLRYVRKPFGAMPAYTSKVLSDQEFTDIYAYLKSLPAARPAREIPLLDQTRDK